MKNPFYKDQQDDDEKKESDAKKKAEMEALKDGGKDAASSGEGLNIPQVGSAANGPTNQGSQDPKQTTTRITNGEPPVPGNAPRPRTSSDEPDDYDDYRDLPPVHPTDPQSK